MALNKDRVWVGSPDQATTGAILSAPVGSVEVPTTIDDFSPSGVKDSGYISEDGLSISINKSFTEIKDWSLAVIRKLVSEYSGELSWSHVALDRQSWENFAGEGNVEWEDATTEHGNRGVISFNADESARKTFIFKIKDGERRLLVFVPEGQVDGSGSLNLKSGEAVGLEITLKTFPDKEGNHFYIIFDDGQKLASSDS